MMTLRKFLVILLLAALIAPWVGVKATPTGENQFQIPGLHDKVTIRLDQTGIPHIYATNSHDLFLAQGFMHASDRWWQMEWQRHQSAGRASEVVGTKAIDTDIFMRTLGLPRHAAHDLEQLAPSTREVLDAYSEGINARLQGKQPEDLALEYAYLNSIGNSLAVEPWTPFDTMLIQAWEALGFTSTGLGSELLKAAVIQQAGQLGGMLIVPGYPYSKHPVIIEKESAATQPVNTTGFAPLNPIASSFTMLDVPRFASNNWVVSGKLTKSGLPLLANDTHMGASIPGAWYEVGLHCAPVSADCPYDVYGFSFAGSPGVVIGHNPSIGWGITNGFTDNTDVYLLSLNPANPLQYKFDDGYADLETLSETIRPWNADPRPITIRLSKFGPVFESLFGVNLGQPFAVRWSAVDGNYTLDGVLNLDKAANWNEFEQALASWDLPGVHFVYADVSGNIGYLNAGRIPKRVKNHDGSLPVDGTTDQYLWQGYVDPKDNPRLLNPELGFIVTANNPPLAPGDYPYPITSFTDYGYRAARIDQLIPQTARHDVQSFAQIQYDNYNPAAELVIPVLQSTRFNDSDLNDLVAWLAQWDYQNDADSPQAALFNIFWGRLLRLGLEELPIYDASHSLYILSTIINSPIHPLWANKDLGLGIDARTKVLQMALQQALDEAIHTLGKDRKTWRWDSLHVVKFKSDLAGGLPIDQIPDALKIFNREIGVSGGLASVNTQDWSVASGNYEVDKLPGMRMILDFSNFEHSKFLNTTGSSGDPRSPHYDDAMSLWAVGDYYDHHFSMQSVEAQTATIWLLTP